MVVNREPKASVDLRSRSRIPERSGGKFFATRHCSYVQYVGGNGWKYQPVGGLLPLVVLDVCKFHGALVPQSAIRESQQ